MRQRKGTVNSFIFKWDIDVLREAPELEEASITGVLHGEAFGKGHFTKC